MNSQPTGNVLVAFVYFVSDICYTAISAEQTTPIGLQFTVPAFFQSQLHFMVKLTQSKEGKTDAVQF